MSTSDQLTPDFIGALVEVTPASELQNGSNTRRKRLLLDGREYGTVCLRIPGEPWIWGCEYFRCRDGVIVLWTSGVGTYRHLPELAIIQAHIDTLNAKRLIA